MAIQRETIIERLKELDTVLTELGRHRAVTAESLRADLGVRWIIERGLIAAAAIVFDIADHILVNHAGYYASTYEESLQALEEQGVISNDLYRQLRGLGGLRNILVHRYLQIDPDEVLAHYRKGLDVFPRFAEEILSWLDAHRSE